MPKVAAPFTVRARSLECHGMLWQALVEGSFVELHRNTDKSITCLLVSGGYVLASVSIRFRTFKAMDAAMVHAESTGRFNVIEGASRIVL